MREGYASALASLALPVTEDTLAAAAERAQAEALERCACSACSSTVCKLQLAAQAAVAHWLWHTLLRQTQRLACLPVSRACPICNTISDTG